MVQVEPNMYLSDLSSSSEGSLGRLEESDSYYMSKTWTKTRCENIKIKFHKCMEFFLIEGGLGSYDDETI